MAERNGVKAADNFRHAFIPKFERSAKILILRSKK
jgi:hypothetical protein